MADLRVLGRGGFRGPLKVSDFILDHLSGGDDYISAMHRAYRQRLIELAEEKERRRPYHRTTYHSFEMAVQKLSRAGQIEFSGREEVSDLSLLSGGLRFTDPNFQPVRRYYKLAGGAVAPPRPPVKPTRPPKPPPEVVTPEIEVTEYAVPLTAKQVQLVNRFFPKGAQRFVTFATPMKIGEANTLIVPIDRLTDAISVMYNAVESTSDVATDHRPALALYNALSDLLGKRRIEDEAEKPTKPKRGRKAKK